MKTLHPAFAPSLVGVLLAAAVPAAAQVPNTLLHSLFDTNPPASQRGVVLGWSVAVEGNTIVAGGPGPPARVKVFDAATGVLRHSLTNPNPAGYGFGRSVAVSDSRVAVGAFEDYIPGVGSVGRAYIYDLASSTPTVPATVLTNPNPALGDQFGFTVDIAGTRVAVSATGDDTGADNAGTVYLYDLASATPALPVLTLTNPSPAQGELFGNAIASVSSRLVIGGYHDNDAYVFDLASATPTVPVATLTNPRPAYDGNGFGFAVDISGEMVIIGAWEDGICYVYDLASSTPALPALTLTNPSPTVQALRYFGYSVSISGTRAIVGFHTAQRVHVYELASITPTLPIATLDNFSFNTVGFSYYVSAMDGATVVVGAAGDDTKEWDAGAIYVFGPRPALSIARATPGFATISWTPATTSGFRLQYKDSVTSGQWVNAPSGATNRATISVTNASRFYRLFQP